ncbi:MAG: GAF domain-containing protein [Bacilli bacterium]|nr:GAF domain-containing protein [Bacilli bacterium]
MWRNKMIEKIKAIIDDKIPLVSNLSNVSAILNEMEDINWCGFYLAKDETLYLGPFQGEVACTTIPFGKGVCGTAAQTKKTLIVDNVLEFKGHIACSSKSRSEIVTPIIKGDTVVGVIDIDSPSFSRFNKDDQDLLEEVARNLAILF